MSKRMKVAVLLAGIASTTAFGSHLALAQEGAKPFHQGAGGYHHEHRFMHKHFDEMAAKLGLSEQQKAKVKEIFNENREQAKPIFDRLRTEKRNLRALVQAEKTDEAAIRTQAAKLGTIHGDLAIHHARMAKQIRAILTPEQIEKFKAMQKERDQKFDRFRERHGKGWDKDQSGN